MLRLGPSARKIMSYLSYISLSWWSVEWSKNVYAYVSISHVKDHAHESHDLENQIDLMMRRPVVGVEILATIKWVEVSWWYYHFHMGSIDNQFPHFLFCFFVGLGVITVIQRFENVRPMYRGKSLNYWMCEMPKRVPSVSILAPICASLIDYYLKVPKR